MSAIGRKRCVSRFSDDRPGRVVFARIARLSSRRAAVIDQVELARFATIDDGANVILSELVAAHGERIIRRWTEKVRGTLHPAAMPRLELVDHLPGFLTEIADALRSREHPDGSPTAIEHGVQRFTLGFSLDAVVREYGALREAIAELAAAEGVVVDSAERDTLFACVITGIADAVSEYQRQRDAERDRQTSEHFAFLAHELRNPLGTAVTALSMLRRGQSVSDDRLLGFADRSLTKMHDLLERSLRLAQVGSGITLRREKTMMRPLLDDAIASASADAEAKGVSLVLHVDVDGHVDVDVRLIHSAVTNLVRNAVKFTHDGSSVEIRGHVAATRMTIEVEDRCGGWLAGKVDTAFVPFVQLGSDRSGYGLGLAIAKQAADAHGGSIRIQNLPGKGCVVVLELPVALPD